MSTLTDLAGAATCCDWHNEQHSILRLLKYSNVFSRFSLVLGIGFVVFLCLETANSDPDYQCNKWSIYATLALGPYYKSSSESFGQWVFVLFSALLYVVVVVNWGRQSSFAQDGHPRR